MIAPALAALLVATTAPASEDFIQSGRWLFAHVACASDKPTAEVPLGPLPPLVREDHCRRLGYQVDAWLKRFRKNVLPIRGTMLEGAPHAPVVYPFGGGDLITALGMFPEADEITTVSLETAGDARALGAMQAEALATELGRVRGNISALLAVEHSRTENLSAMARAGVPAEVIFALVALRAHGFEPVSLRYFELGPDGTPSYLDAAHLPPPGRRRPAAFANVELGYRRPGENRTRIFRHLAANLADETLSKDERVLAHLRAKGRVVVMTKAASYLLWWDTFSRVRSYVAEQADFVLSDSTGLPPDVAGKHGFSATTYGDFKGPFIPTARAATAHAMAALWASQPKRPLPFRFGYPDAAGNNHLMVLTRAAAR